MGRFGSFLLGLILGAAAVFGALKYHIVYADDGVHFVPKIYANFDEIYVDIRDFDPADWYDHVTLAAALVTAGKGDLLGKSVLDKKLQESIANIANIDQVRESLDSIISRVLTNDTP